MKFRNIVPLLMFLVLVSCHSQPPGEHTTEVEFLTANKSANKPFSEAVRVGKWLILSGQLGIDPESGKLAPGGIKAETRQTMENIKRVLEKHGSSFDRVVKCTVMLADISDWPVMNEVYVSYFPVHKPARSAFGARGLALGARVEIECWAIIK